MQAIREAGGEVFAITSEPQSLATEAEEDWEFGFAAIGDPHHEILDQCRQRGWLEVFVNTNYGHLRNRSWASHPKGYYQPAVLALGADARVLYRWRCRPTYGNMSGAGARPEAIYTWHQIQARLKSESDAPHDDNPELGAEDISWPRFLSILLAHGWFLRPKAFPLGRAEDAPSVSPGKMNRRLYLFVALWLVALVVLPASWVGWAFLAWVVAVIPGLIEIHRQFQHEP